MSPFQLIKPKLIPPYEEGFRPAVLANHAFLAEADRQAVPLIIGLERENGKISRYETRVFPEDHPRAAANLFYAERLLKFLLWQRGGFRIYIGGPRNIGQYLQRIYAPGGAREFDYSFMGEQVYEHPFTIIPCAPEEVPPAKETGRPLGRHLDGCRIGFDLGASDRKASAVIDGKVVFSEEVIWEPRKHADPDSTTVNSWHATVRRFAHAARRCIGGSSPASIDNRPMVASLFAASLERFDECGLSSAHPKRNGCPHGSDQRGDVTALAGPCR
jgi:hypothetical protein